MWPWLTANAQQLSVLVTTAYTFLTGIVVLLMWRSNRQMRLSIEQSARAEEGRSRPYVVVEFVRERSGFITFRVMNFGRSAAKALRITSEPEIKPVRAAGSVKTVGGIPEFIGLFKHPIPYLAPSQHLDALVGHYSGIRESFPGLAFTLSLDYEGIGGPHHETLQLSLKATDESLHLQDYDLGKEIHEVQDVLRRIEAKLKT